MQCLDDDTLLLEARNIVKYSYSPYSSIKVAAILIDETMNLFRGVNVENSSYGLTICAERNALFSSITDGASKLIKMVVVGFDSEGNLIKTLSPCGACRQVIGELMAPDADILYYKNGALVSNKVDFLLPHRFSLDKSPYQT